MIKRPLFLRYLIPCNSKRRILSQPLFLSCFLHAILISLFFIDFSATDAVNHPTPKIQANIVQATALDQTAIEAEVARLRHVEQTKKNQALARQRHLDEQARKARLARQKEQKRLAKLKAAQLKLAQQQAQQKVIEAKKLAALKTQQQKATADLAKLKKQQAAQKQAAEKKAKQKQRENLLQSQITQEKKSRAAAHQKWLTTETARYKHLILAAISRRWILPNSTEPKLSCRLLISLSVEGKVLDVQLAKSSGNSPLDRSAIAAVYKASPLPVPTDSELFATFQKLNLTVRPEEVL